MAFHILGHLDLRVSHRGEKRLQTSIDMLQEMGLRETEHHCSHGISVIAQTLTTGGWTNGHKVRQENSAGMKTVTHSHSPGRTNLTNKAKLGPGGAGFFISPNYKQDGMLLKHTHKCGHHKKSNMAMSATQSGIFYELLKPQKVTYHIARTPGFAE